jgi:hypothetical protein
MTRQKQKQEQIKINNKNMYNYPTLRQKRAEGWGNRDSPTQAN